MLSGSHLLFDECLVNMSSSQGGIFELDINTFEGIAKSTSRILSEQWIPVFYLNGTHWLQLK